MLRRRGRFLPRYNYNQAVKQGGYIFTVHLCNLVHDTPLKVCDFDKIGSESFIKMQLSALDRHRNLYRLKFSLRFTEKPSHIQSEFFKLSVYFNKSPKYEHLFRLDKIDEMNYASEEKLVFDSTLCYPLSDADVEIFVPEDVHNELTKDLGELLSGETHSDWKLCVEDKVFHVHKGILAVRSKVLAKMIDADMIEKQTNMIKLDQWDPVVVKELLHYIYTHSCDLSINPHELFKLSHYLEVEPLIIMCKNYLLVNVNEDNIVDSLMLVSQDQYGLSKLKTALELFVSSNKLRLSKNSNYVTYLSKTMDVNNLISRLKFSQQYKVESLLDYAVRFIIKNHKETLKIDECKRFFVNHPSTLLKLFGDSLEKIDSLERKIESKRKTVDSLETSCSEQ